MKLQKLEDFILSIPQKLLYPFKKLSEVDYKKLFSKESFKGFFHNQSITKRWLLNMFSVIALIITVVCVSLVFIITRFYRSSVEQQLRSGMNILTTEISRLSYDQTANHNSEIRTLVETYEDKDIIELMAIDRNGNVAVTSSGFEFDDSSLFEEQYTNDGVINIVELSTGEEAMSLTTSIDESASQFVALRMVTSLEAVNSRIFLLSLIVIIISLSLLAFIFTLGFYFVRTIKKPIDKIATMARQYATGDFSKRLEPERDDELGKLCESVNFMAAELSNSETMKNEFISQVSHELRTPLTAIKGWSETLTAIDDRETFIKGMRVISSESERLSQMVEELLDFSRIQDGKLMLNMVNLDILAELGETVLIYQERAKALGITLNYYEPEMLPAVYGDKNRLRQVFINIVDNAIKYSDSGDMVNVEAYEEKGQAVISVSDTGIGIDANDLPKVKTKFFKADSTRRGSGIGLAVADEIITLHGGTLEIDSQKGVGTTVIIKLPCKESKKPSNDKSVNVEVISTVEERNDFTNGEQNTGEV
ncbi:MAG: HAMP domain-containing histidine kinase [Ruminococcus sp.]|nr:HAMP domain-containing histidine kinase [Ruminococcus sp.]